MEFSNPLYAPHLHQHVRILSWLTFTFSTCKSFLSKPERLWLSCMNQKSFADELCWFLRARFLSFSFSLFICQKKIYIDIQYTTKMTVKD